MLLTVARDSRRARRMARRSPLTRVMPALSIATSVPVRRERRGIDATLPHQLGRAKVDRPAVDARTDSFAGRRPEVRHRGTTRCRIPVLARIRGGDEGRGERMLAAALDRGGETENV